MFTTVNQRCRLAPNGGLLGFVFEGYCQESDLLRTADRQNISEQVIAMRSQNPSLSQAEIARHLGVNKMRVCRILAREESDENTYHTINEVT
jgi:hypothetical protein